MVAAKTSAESRRFFHNILNHTKAYLPEFELPDPEFVLVFFNGKVNGCSGKFYDLQ
jgi:hypothetical protein